MTYVHSGKQALICSQAGDSGILVEFGPMTLDIIVRARIHAFQKVIEDSSLLGVERLCPCIRSIMVSNTFHAHFLFNLSDGYVVLL